MSHNIPRSLSDVQFVLLGLLLEGEKTGTELREILRDNYQWNTKSSSFYTYYNRLKEAGFCSIKTTQAGKKFRLTAKGKKTYHKKLKFIEAYLNQ